MKHKIRVNQPGRGNYTIIKISLDDDCRNGRESWSLTADIFENGEDAGGGCCHDHILALRFDLKPFADLHLADFEGYPMHAWANAFYWFAGWKGGLGLKYHAGQDKTADECKRILGEHIRATDADLDVLAACGAMTEEELQVALEDMGFPARWRAESLAAIRTLEQLTGGTFTTSSTKPAPAPVSQERRAVIAERRASGYYSPEQVAARLTAKVEADTLKALDELEKEHAAKLESVAAGYMVDRWIVRKFGRRFGSNLIYYRHTNSLVCNWNTTDRTWSAEEFAALEAETDKSALPAGMKWEFKGKGAR